RSSRRLSLARTPAVQREVAPNKLSCVVLSVIQHIPLLLLEIVLNLYSAINNPSYFYEAILVKSHFPHFRMSAASVHLSVLINPILFTQVALENFACAAFGQRFVKKFDDARNFIPCNKRTGMSDQLFVSNAHAWLADDDGMHGLAPVFSRDTDDGSFQHGGMGVEGVLDLDGVDIFAAGDDHILCSIDDKDVVFLIDGRQIAGMHPTIDNSGGGRLRH